MQKYNKEAEDHVNELLNKHNNEIKKLRQDLDEQLTPKVKESS